MANEMNRPVWNAVDYAVRSGRLMSQPCEVCGALETDAHHDDYSKPLDVRWLCRTHHSAQHGRRGRKRSEVCPRGHERTPENTYIHMRPKANGSGLRDVRHCRVCQKERESR